MIPQIKGIPNCCLSDFIFYSVISNAKHQAIHPPSLLDVVTAKGSKEPPLYFYSLYYDGLRFDGRPASWRTFWRKA